MANTTQSNIDKKRKRMQQRRRRKIFRAIFMCVIMVLICSATLFLGLGVYNIAGRVYDEFSAIYEGYNERRTARTGEIDPKFDGYTNILILGIDDGENGGREADTILLLSFSNDTGKSRLISIPRDTWVSADSSAGRIGSLYTWGGASLIVRHISNLLGISIHQYVIIDMSTFAELVDIFGGVDIYVEENMDYEDPESGLKIHLGQGYQHLNGEESQKYLRYRGGRLGDVGRVQRQQKFFKAFYAKVLQLDTIPKLPAIADIFRNKMETSAEIFDSAHLANVLRKMSSDPPNTVMLPGRENELGIWEPNLQEIDARIQELFPVQDISEEIVNPEEEE
jgi:LCP family protein required for cell wall assembly